VNAVKAVRLDFERAWAAGNRAQARAIVLDAYKTLRRQGMSTTDSHNAVLDLVPFSWDAISHVKPARDFIGDVVTKDGRKLDRSMGRRSGRTEKYEVRSLDVWGNARDGFEVNNSFRAGHVEVPPHASDRDFLRALRDGGFLSAASSGGVVIKWEDDVHADVNLRRSDMPLLQLSRV
jgi:hypothetical protein